MQKANADAKKKAVKDKKSARKKEKKEKKAEKEKNDAEAAAKKAKKENAKLAEQIHKKLAGCYQSVAEVISHAMCEHLPAVIKEPFATGAETLSEVKTQVSLVVLDPENPLLKCCDTTKKAAAFCSSLSKKASICKSVADKMVPRT